MSFTDRFAYSRPQRQPGISGDPCHRAGRQPRPKHEGQPAPANAVAKQQADDRHAQARLVKKLERPEAQRPSVVTIAVPEVARYSFSDGP